MKRIKHREEALLAHFQNFSLLPFVRWYDCCDSTNEQARNLAAKGERSLHLLAADIQTCGRGQRGRVWHSPEKSGLWFSILAAPQMTLEETTRLTVKTAIGVQNFLKTVFSINATIKHPNDLLVGSKKICGILAESDSIAGRTFPEFVVIGTGLNIETSFPEDLKDTGTSVKEHYKGVIPPYEQLMAQLFMEIMKATKLLPPVVLRG